MAKARAKKRNKSALNPDISAEAIHAYVRELTGSFGRALPRELQSSGAYVTQEGDPYWHREFGVPDGKYRVSGGDLVMRFRDGWLEEVFLPRAPDYGGSDVQIVPGT